MEATDLVLVSVLTAPRDLEIARVLGWYRIPVRSAPRTVEVDGVAFYQTARFGAEKWAIHYTAPVRGHELVTRAELLRAQPDHPRAGEQYFKLLLGPLERLPQPIPSRAWRRLTFFYTTGERLAQARELNDLIIQSAERDQLWRALRERGLAAERQYAARSGGEADLAVLCELGALLVRLGSDGPPASVSNERWLNLPEPADLPGAVRAVEQAVSELGGPAHDRG